MRYYFRIACQPQRYDCGLTCRTQPQLSYVLKSVKEYTASTLIIPGPFRLLSFGRFSVSNTFPTPTGPTFLSFVTFVRPRRVSVKPSTSRWVGFHLLIVLDIALVFGSVYWDRTNLLRLTAGHTHHEYQDGIKLWWIRQESNLLARGFTWNDTSVRLLWSTVFQTTSLTQ